MSEKIENSAVNVPWANFTTVILNGSTGTLFCLGDIESVIVSSGKMFSVSGFVFDQSHNGLEYRNRLPIHPGLR